MSSENEHEELEEYGDTGITSADAPVPTWLKFNYVFWPLWGIVWFYMFWNGSTGWFDRGYWNQLQRAANTTFPYINVDELKPPKLSTLREEQSQPITTAPVPPKQP